MSVICLPVSRSYCMVFSGICKEIWGRKTFTRTEVGRYLIERVREAKVPLSYSIASGSRCCCFCRNPCHSTFLWTVYCNIRKFVFKEIFFRGRLLLLLTVCNVQNNSAVWGINRVDWQKNLANHLFFFVYCKCIHVLLNFDLSFFWYVKLSRHEEIFRFTVDHFSWVIFAVLVNWCCLYSVRSFDWLIEKVALGWTTDWLIDWLRWASSFVKHRHGPTASVIVESSC